MIRFRKQIKEGDFVEVVRDNFTFDHRYKGRTGKVIDLTGGNPFLPSWLSSTNYNVKLDTADGSWENSVFTRGQLKLIKA